MGQTRISIEVHRHEETSESWTLVDSDITLGSSKEATVQLPSETPFLFTLIRCDKENGRSFLQFTDALAGTITIADVSRTLAELKRQALAVGVATLGLWTIELSPEAAGSVVINGTTVIFRLKRGAKILKEHAA